MPFVLLPAVDVADGRSVRPVSGEVGSAFVGDDPLSVARSFAADGATWIHLVDLDAAFGRGSNADLLAAAIAELDVDVELSGGICDDATLDRALATECARVVLSTAALGDPDWCADVIAAHGERIVVALDVRVATTADGATSYRLSARGSAGDHGDVWETLGVLDRAGCRRYVVTDVGRDGLLEGPNVELYRAVTRATTALVVASGGIAAIADLAALADLSVTQPNFEGAIVGTALHAGRLTVPEALAAVTRA